MFRKLVKFFIPRQLFRTIEPYGHLAEAILWQYFYGFPLRGLKVIGVTGTDGKSTTTTLIWKMMAEAGYKVGFMTTIGYGTHLSQKQNYIHMTTDGTQALLKRAIELKKDGIEWLVLETSSHGLAQNRVFGIPYEIAVMTNVTSDHLDYHGTVEKYRDAKKKLFRLAVQGVANADDPNGVDFARESKEAILYGIKAGELRATDVHTSAKGSSFKAKYQSRQLNLEVNLPGDFNVYNALAAGGTGILVGLTDEQIEHGIAALKEVEGRMNTIDEGQDFAAIVDYASTPGGFEAVLPGVKKGTKGRLIVVFGSAGRRDEAKRAIQGSLAGKYADIVVATEEDDRDIDGNEILSQIAEGAEKEGKVRDKDLFLILDRTEAINFAVKQAEPGDTVMFLGKGHEKTIERANGEHPWDEIGEVKKAIRNLKSS